MFRCKPSRTGMSFLVVFLVCLGGTVSAMAHGFGQRYDLPVPLWLYTVGAAATVALSFVIVGLFVRRTSPEHTYWRLDMLRLPVVRALAHPFVLACLRGGAMLLFVALIVAGLFGRQVPTKNLAPTLVWVLWWVGMAYISALCGNLWVVLNPWAIGFEWIERLYRRGTGEAHLARNRPYPRSLGVWPGVLLFVGFAWIELVYEGSAQPSTIAGFALIYSAITWVGMWVFGKEVWLRHGEAFTLVFGILARFAPTEVQVTAPAVCEACRHDCRDRDGACIDCYDCFARATPAERAWNLRPFAVGLVRNARITASEMVFVLLLLATVTFDGFMATPLWVDIETALQSILGNLGVGQPVVVRTFGLVVSVLLFLEVYLIFSVLMGLTSGKRVSGLSLALVFAFSLVPIAIAYHIAHYLSYLLVQGQYIIRLISDPFGWGWDLFGTRAYRINIGIVGARFGWYTAVITIIVGHVVAVYLAHIVAIRTLRDHALALRSQYPMLVLMVGYTVMSLWILAQPIVEGDTTAAVPQWSVSASAQLHRGQALSAPTTAEQAHRIVARLQPLPWQGAGMPDVLVRSSVLCFCLDKASITLRALRQRAAERFQTGRSALLAHRYLEAITAFTRTIHLAPRHASAYTNRGIAYGNTGRLQEAYADFTQALALDPQQTLAREARQATVILLHTPPSTSHISDTGRARIPLVGRRALSDLGFPSGRHARGVSALF